MHDGNYTVAVSNDFGTVTSNPIELVIKPSKITISPLNLELIWVKPGTFVMGSPLSETGRDSDENQTTVNITKGYFLGKFEVTQAQYETVMTGNDAGYSATPSGGGTGGLALSSGPVFQITHTNAMKFIEILNNSNAYKTYIPEGYVFDLPTEAQWEYACRAGTETPNNLGTDLTTDNANILGRNSITSVGSFPPNLWGFYDMHGNVFEFVSDWYAPYQEGPLFDPLWAFNRNQKSN